ncbi:YsnF/AvaK domain-containing protein [Lichenicoccus sp.]|uniref:YsnF/AvaK domain-containing protein n=1 Tax=Lichenicoccus sp. TaxID=2781899 RepID=UPI003D0F06C1
MTEETIIAVYDSVDHAEAAKRDLTAAGVPPGAISQHADAGSLADGTSTGAPREQGFWSRLFGGEPDHDTAVYDRSLAGGSTVLSVKVPDEHVTAVSDILERHNPVDIDERASTYGLASGTRAETYAAPATPAVTPVAAPGLNAGRTTAPAAGETIQLAEEQLVVGRRAINRGTTRVRRFVVETPVEEQVTLHDEAVRVDRQPVTDGRAVSGEAFTDKAIEMTETGEEAVVGKTTRVREEVSLRKEAVDRLETVRDTVRREDVEIEHVPGETPVDRKI